MDDAQEWHRAKSTFPIGSEVEVVVEKLMPFGMFVRLPGTPNVSAVIDAITYRPGGEDVLDHSRWPAEGAKITAVVADHVEPCDPIYMWAFFTGCVEANAALRAPIRSLLDDVPGPSGAEAWSRAYLLYAPGEAVRIVLNRLCQTTIEDDFEPGPSAWTSPVPAVIDAVGQGRWGLVLGECSVLWLANHLRGFHAALERWLPDRARTERERLQAFESWLAARYGQGPVPWHRLLRVFEGEGPSGVEKFVELWETWQQEITR